MSVHVKAHLQLETKHTTGSATFMSVHVKAHLQLETKHTHDSKNPIAQMFLSLQRLQLLRQNLRLIYITNTQCHCLPLCYAKTF